MSCFRQFQQIVLGTFWPIMEAIQINVWMLVTKENSSRNNHDDKTSATRFTFDHWEFNSMRRWNVVCMRLKNDTSLCLRLPRVDDMVLTGATKTFEGLCAILLLTIFHWVILSQTKLQTLAVIVYKHCKIICPPWSGRWYCYMLNAATTGKERTSKKGLTDTCNLSISRRCKWVKKLKTCFKVQWVGELKLTNTFKTALLNFERLWWRTMQPWCSYCYFIAFSAVSPSHRLFSCSSVRKQW